MGAGHVQAAGAQTPLHRPSDEDGLGRLNGPSVPEAGEIALGVQGCGGAAAGGGDGLAVRVVDGVTAGEHAR